jgi:hypothetical protein
VALLVGLSGCSLFLSGPDSKRPLHTRPDCSTNKGAVAVDGVMAGLLTVGGLSQLGNGTHSSGDAVGVPLAFGALYALAAVYGNSKVNDCNNEIARFERVEQPQLADKPAGGDESGRRSRDDMARAIAARKRTVEAQEAAQQLGPPATAGPPVPNRGRGAAGGPAGRSGARNMPGPATSGPATSGPATSGPATSGPATSGPAMSGPATSGGASDSGPDDGTAGGGTSDGGAASGPPAKPAPPGKPASPKPPPPKAPPPKPPANDRWDDFWKEQEP